MSHVITILIEEPRKGVKLDLEVNGWGYLKKDVKNEIINLLKIN